MIVKLRVLFSLCIILSLGSVLIIKQRFISENLATNLYKKISCFINNQSHYCFSFQKEIYIPFNISKTSCELYGETREINGDTVFELYYSSNLKIYDLKEYQWHGIYPSFEYFNVEQRSRVVCISGKDSVPVSNQWDKNGYYYPTQIAQFGLSHYSKYIKNPKEIIQTVMVPNSHSKDLKIDLSHVSRTNTHVKLSIQNFGDSCDVKFKILAHSRPYFLVYKIRRSSNGLEICYSSSRDQIIYTIHGGEPGSALDLERYLTLDASKALKIKPNEAARSLEIAELSFANCGSDLRVRSLAFSTNLNLAFAKSAAGWFVRNQDAKSGWAVPVARHDSKSLAKPWYSGMSHGQAISLLVRYYHVTRDQRYVDVALEALNLLNRSVADGGVKTFFADKYLWLEEYPTSPSSFVLNGFIYTIVGLYDLKECLGSLGRSDDSLNRLYSRSLDSLRFMLPLFDSGSRNFYDLTHVTMRRSPNVARWDYHIVHLNLLRMLRVMTNDQLFDIYYDRWKGYLYGIRAKHN